MKHIDSFSVYESHYNRHDNPNIKYIGVELDITTMYSLYKEWAELMQKVVSQDYYYRTFGNKRNLGFKISM